MKPITLHTERLILRRTINADIENLFHHYASDSISAQFLTRLPHASSKQTADFLNKWCDIPWIKECDKFAWVVSLKETNEAIGTFLVSLEGEHKAEIHFGIGRMFWQQGLATEFCRSALEWLIAQPKLERIWAVCDLCNYGSAKVLEHIGLQKEGILKNWLKLPAFGDSARDCFVFSKTVIR